MGFGHINSNKIKYEGVDKRKWQEKSSSQCQKSLQKIILEMSDNCKNNKSLKVIKIAKKE